MAGLPPPPDMGAGRGRGMTLPSWMTGSSVLFLSSILFWVLVSVSSSSFLPFFPIFIKEKTKTEKQKSEKSESESESEGEG